MTPLRVLHAGDGFVVLDKPSGVSLFADRSGAPALWPLLEDSFERPLQVHRIDKGTSGCLLVALDPELQAFFTRAFADQRVGKWYAAVCRGTPAGRRIDLPLMPGRKSRYRVAGQREDIVLDHGTWRLHRQSREQRSRAHPASTAIRVVRSGRQRSLVSLRPHTGRTHQLRVHLSWIGHPLLGEHLYGAPKAPEQQWPRLALHAHRLVLPVPGAIADGATLTVRSPLPEQFLRAVSPRAASG